MKTNVKNILVLRFSSLGDVAMTVPVMKLLLDQHPEISVTFVSQPAFEPLFEGIQKIHFVGLDIKNEFKGLSGLARAAKIINKIPFCAVADLHDVIRTKIIRQFFRGVPVSIIDKGRKEKRELTRFPDKIFHQLKSTFQRYADVFSKLGFPVDLNNQPPPYHRSTQKEEIKKIFNPDTGLRKLNFIGVAPFAKHPVKMYPIEKMEKVINTLAENPSNFITLFGSKNELASIKKFTNKKNITILPEHTFSDELKIISQLDVMLSMDSANMHLASLYGIPVVSVWGGTHPFAGFYGWGQDLKNAIQTELPCRPSSVYGNKPCPLHGNEGCMSYIIPQMITDKINEVLNSKFDFNS